MKLGIGPGDRIRTNAATETHLLRDAESTLGHLVWEHVEPIEELSSDYWSLRKLSNEHQKISQKVDPLSARLNAVQEERKLSAETIAEQGGSKPSQLEDIKRKAERLNRERASVIEEGTNIKRKQEGLRAKIDVLAEEGPAAADLQLAKARTEIEDHQKRFETLRKRRASIENELRELQSEEIRLSKAIEDDTSGNQGEASPQLNEISQLNRQLTEYQNKLGALESKALPLHAHIGKHLLYNAHPAEVREATREHRSLFQLIRKIQKSHRLNQDLIKR